MPYDETKDITLGQDTNEDLCLAVKASRYNGGAVKIGVARYYRDGNGNPKWTKLGRMTVKEALWVSEALAKMASSLNTPTDPQAE